MPEWKQARYWGPFNPIAMERCFCSFKPATNSFSSCKVNWMSSVITVKTLSIRTGSLIFSYRAPGLVLAHRTGVERKISITEESRHLKKDWNPNFNFQKIKLLLSSLGSEQWIGKHKSSSSSDGDAMPYLSQDIPGVVFFSPITAQMRAWHKIDLNVLFR